MLKQIKDAETIRRGERHDNNNSFITLNLFQGLNEISCHPELVSGSE
jgi:hypothetical protein